VLRVLGRGCGVNGSGCGEGAELGVCGGDHVGPGPGWVDFEEASPGGSHDSAGLLDAERTPGQHQDHSMRSLVTKSSRRRQAASGERPRQAARETMDRAYEEKQSAYEKQQGAWDYLQQVRDRNGSRIDYHRMTAVAHGGSRREVKHAAVKLGHPRPLVLKFPDKLTTFAG
jgi:hypothetical protein